MSQVEQQKNSAPSMTLLILVPVLFMGLIVSVFIYVVRRDKEDAPPNSVPLLMNPAEACSKAVTCCLAMAEAIPNPAPQKQICPRLRDLSVTECAKQYEAFRSAAEKLHVACD